ncbi:MAG: class I SAM-dependent methyltransferase [Hydrogenophaga sp.]|uniref:Class I SAM-dependent methyltransferase n=1 Tax=Hydrogenophaga crocea TaxID=2716225 RepID=A0A6G8IKY8_9BURK|nr:MULTISPECIES: cyclopropane-fatty-acyl-phospholipid synthase family protein [Hydrogenophaga]MBL0945881.1 class I SAM-dependent methyltransferase [Hydrogenophaga sp.]QIM53688.1 class I SAM-dependent methyltransferase [Hydrogenophaga crocea]
MNSTTASHPATGFVLPRNAPAAARTVLQLLQRLAHGSLTVTLPDGSVQRFGRVDGPHASIRLNNWNVCGAVLKSGDIGFAETYMAGDWHTPHLVALMELMLLNRRALEDVIHGSWLGRLAYRVQHLLNHNSKANSRKNIHAHYDLGNAFYERWLDRTMNYSSAWFQTPELSEEEAQHAKVRRALQLAGVRPGDRVLEIGCGWGALAEKATTEFGASVVGVTLSTEQLDFARERMQRIGSAERADLRLQDYRDIADAPFDAICSIEMVEAVGRAYWPTYFRTVSRLLKPGGKACIQSIVIADQHFERYIRGTDFIQQYIFPGGCLPCPSAFREQAAQAGLEVVDEFAFGQDYARTLRGWRERFMHEQEAVLQLGFDERFIRTWEFYLAYCEAAFAEGSTDVVQYTLRKPG